MADKPLTQTTGRRKGAVARVRLRPGTGVITIANGQSSGSLTVIVANDAVLETTENVEATISNPS